MVKRKFKLLVIRRSISVNSLPYCQVCFGGRRKLAVNTVPFRTIIMDSAIRYNPSGAGSCNFRIRITSRNKHHSHTVYYFHVFHAVTVKNHVLCQKIHEVIHFVSLPGGRFSNSVINISAVADMILS